MRSKFQHKRFYFCLLPFAFCLCFAACSIPVLESDECVEARNVVREFYSFHFGNDMRFSRENLRAREKYLSGRLKRELSARDESAKDYFTATEDYPKAFRVGGCEASGPGRLRFEVLLFWRDERRSEERKIFVEAARDDGKWLIDKVSDTNK